MFSARTLHCEYFCFNCMRRVQNYILTNFWKQLVSEIGTREQMGLAHVFER